MRLAAYCRVSTEKEEQMDSLAHQKEFFLEYAGKYGHELVRLYADEGISGTSLKKRVQFQQMMHDAQQGLFEMVVVKDISRMARNTVDLLQSIRRLKSMGINVLFVNANMASLGESEFVLTIFGAMAQEESENLSKRVKWGKEINAKKGRVPQRIYGYERINNFTLQINEEEAEVVRWIFRLYVEEGLGCRAICTRLNDKHIKTKLGCSWAPCGVRRILGNSIYCGTYVNHKYEIADVFSRRQVPVPQAQHFYHERPQWAIVSPQIFERAQAILHSRSRPEKSGEQRVQGRHSAKYPLSTLIKCEHCGRSFCRKSYTHVKTRIYWKCSTNDQGSACHCDNRVKLEEQELLFQLQQYFCSKIVDKARFVDDVWGLIAQASPDMQDIACSKQQIAKRIQKLVQKKRRYQELYANGLLTLEEIRDRLAAVEGELKLAQAEQSEWERRSDDCQRMQAMRTQGTEELLRFFKMENITHMDMSKLIAHISVNRDGTVRIFLRDFRCAPEQDVTI